MYKRTSISNCYKSFKKYGDKYFNELTAFHEVEYNINKLTMTEIANFLTTHEKIIISNYDNKWTFNLFLKCVERFIKSKKKINKQTKGRWNNSIYKINYTGMIY
jgi:CRISPR/Cas system-associated endonuclease Cas3-HD